MMYASLTPDEWRQAGNRVPLRVGDVCLIPKWAMAPIAAVPLGGKRVTVEGVVPDWRQCNNVPEYHEHADIRLESEHQGSRVRVCALVLAPWGRQLRIGDLVRCAGNDVPVKLISADGFVIGRERKIRKWTSHGLCHANGIEIIRPDGCV